MIKTIHSTIYFKITDRENVWNARRHLDRFRFFVSQDLSVKIKQQNDLILFESDLNNIPDTLNNWFKLNRLSLNAVKTKLMIYRI